MGMFRNGMGMTRSELDSLFGDNISISRPIDQLMINHHGVMFEWEIGVVMDEESPDAAAVCYIRQTGGTFQIFVVDKHAEISLLTVINASETDTVTKTFFKTNEAYYKKAFQPFLTSMDSNQIFKFGLNEMQIAKINDPKYGKDGKIFVEVR